MRLLFARALQEVAEALAERRDYLLRVRMNPWLADRKEGRKLRALWPEQGVFWMSEIQSIPLKLHVEASPRASACWLQAD